MALMIVVGLGIGVGLATVLWGLFPPPLTLRAALARLSGEHTPAPLDVVGHRVGGARRVAGHLVDTNVKKIPRLAEIVLPDLAITGTPTETFAVKVVGYGDRARTARPGALGRHGRHRHPSRASKSPPSACSSSARRGRSARSSICTRQPSAAVGTSAIRCPPTRRWCRWPWPAPWDGPAHSRSPSGVSSTDWAMDEIAQSLLWAQAYRKAPWEGLEALALRFNLPELTDLARAMAQAGDGARIRDSLDAKAKSLRLKETSALEDAAQAVTQKMLLPGVLLMAGYGVLVFYPALAAFTGSHI